MVLSIGEKIKGFLFMPSETFDASKEDTLGDAFKYFIVILVIYTVLISIMFILSMSSVMPQVLAMIGGTYLGTIITFIFKLVLGIIGIFITGLWTHMGVYLVGGGKGVTQTIKAVLAVIIAIAIPLIIYVAINAAFMATMSCSAFQGPAGPGFGGF